MPNLKAIRIRIASVKSTRQITSAMKMVSAAKLRKAQDKIVRLRPYANKLYEIIVGLSQSLADSEVENIYGRVSAPEKILIVMITSNRGLCGAFNSNVIKEARRIISEKYSDQFKNGNLKLMTVGKKGLIISGSRLSICYPNRITCFMIFHLIMLHGWLNRL